MIDQALRFLVERLNNYLGIDPPEVVSGCVPVGQQAPTDSAGYHGDKVVVSVVNIRLDHALANNLKAVAPQPDVARIHGYGTALPGLEILLLFSARKSPGQYDLALHRISQIIGFFNREPVLSAEVQPGLRSAGIRKLSFYFQPLTLEELHQIWSINGGRYLPSVLYNMKIDLNESGHAV
jgi:hypothetical protein